MRVIRPSAILLTIALFLAIILKLLNPYIFPQLVWRLGEAAALFWTLELILMLKINEWRKKFLEPGVLIAAAIMLLVAVAFEAAMAHNDLANKLAIYVYYFLAVGVVWMFVNELRSKK